jgi:hypothetical protein
VLLARPAGTEELGGERGDQRVGFGGETSAARSAAKQNPRLAARRVWVDKTSEFGLTRAVLGLGLHLFD